MRKKRFVFSFLSFFGSIACSDKTENFPKDMDGIAQDMGMESDASITLRDASDSRDEGFQVVDQSQDTSDASSSDLGQMKDLASPNLDQSVMRDMALSLEERACRLAKGMKQTIEGGVGGDLADNPKLNPPQGAYFFENTMFGVGAHLSFETTGITKVALFFSEGADVMLFQNSKPDGTGGSSRSPQRTVDDLGCSELKQGLIFESVQAGAHLMRIKSPSPPVTLVLLVM